MVQFQSVEEVTAALRRRASLVAFVFALGCVFSVFFALGQQKLYLATAVVQVDTPRIPDPESGRSLGEDSVRRIELIKQHMTASGTLLEIGERLGLFAPDAPEAEPLSRTERLIMMREAVRVSEIADDRLAQPRTAPYALIIDATLDDPDDAAALANAVMAAGIAEARAQTRARAREALAFFDVEAARLEAEITALEERIAAFRRENDAALPSSIAVLRGQLATLEATAFEIDREIAQAESTASRQRAETRAQRIDILREQKTLIESRIAEIETAIAREPEVARELGALERALGNLQEQYRVIVRQRADAELEKVLDTQDHSGRLEVLERAVPPDQSISRSRRSIAMIGAVASLAVALGLAYALEMLNPAIRSAAQLERQLGITPVISVPYIDRRNPGWRGRMGLVALVLALLVAILAVLQAFGGRLIDPALWGRFLPRQAAG